MKRLLEEFINNFSVEHNRCNLIRDIGWQLHIMYKVHLGELPSYDVYAIVLNFLNNFDRRINIKMNDEQIRDTFVDVIYNTNMVVEWDRLVEWLCENASRANYVNKALKEYSDTKNIYMLLHYARKLFIVDIGNILMEELFTYKDSLNWRWEV